MRCGGPWSSTSTRPEPSTGPQAPRLGGGVHGDPRSGALGRPRRVGRQRSGGAGPRPPHPGGAPRRRPAAGRRRGDLRRRDAGLGRPGADRAGVGPPAPRAAHRADRGRARAPSPRRPSRTAPLRARRRRRSLSGGDGGARAERGRRRPAADRSRVRPHQPGRPGRTRDDDHDGVGRWRRARWWPARRARPRNTC